jgi:hypothetical protein
MCCRVLLQSCCRGLHAIFTQHCLERSFEHLPYGVAGLRVIRDEGHVALAVVAPHQFEACLIGDGDDVLDAHPSHLGDIGLRERNIGHRSLEKRAKLLPTFVGGDIDDQQVVWPILEILAHAIDEPRVAAHESTVVEDVGSRWAPISHVTKDYRRPTLSMCAARELPGTLERTLSKSPEHMFFQKMARLPSNPLPHRKLLRGALLATNEHVVEHSCDDFL